MQLASLVSENFCWKPIDMMKCKIANVYWMGNVQEILINALSFIHVWWFIHHFLINPRVYSAKPAFSKASNLLWIIKSLYAWKLFSCRETWNLWALVGPALICKHCRFFLWLLFVWTMEMEDRSPLNFFQTLFYDDGIYFLFFKLRVIRLVDDVTRDMWQINNSVLFRSLLLAHSQRSAFVWIINCKH